MSWFALDSLLWYIKCAITLITTTICTISIFLKIRAISFSKQRIPLYVIGIIISIIFVILNYSSNIISKTVYILLVCTILSLQDKKAIFASIPTSIISLALSYCFEYISVLIVGTGFFLINYLKNDIIVSICASTLQILLSWGLLKINRIRKIFLLLDNEINFGIGLLCSCYVLVFSIFLTTKIDYLGNELSAVVFLGLPLILTGLTLWIRSIVQRYYKKKISDRADAYTQQEIAEKDEYIQKLEAEVATLAKQLHRDNHLLSSLDHSVQALGNSDTAEQKEQIIDEIHTLYCERNELIAKEQQENKILPSTGIAVIDGALSEMYIKATANGISFDLMVGEKLHYLVNNIISQTDLQTLLCDHIKDAIIAVQSSGNASGKILVSIDKNDGIFEISIRDNGVDFDPDTLAKLGLERVSTHAESGGSGIGFVTTFETLKKTKGSLFITEYESKMPFSKSVSFVFDDLNQFIIHTYRKDKLQSVVKREDIMFI